ncbi:MAG: replication-associated recombination protein A, partial [Bacteroidales bacterium]|nr:replication-associated recombination protein A [Bacteroidales bacterium]
APTQLMKDLDYGKNYKYSHDYQNNFAEQDYLPPEIKDKSLWLPQQNTAENKLKEFLKGLWKNRFK